MIAGIIIGLIAGLLFGITAGRMMGIEKILRSARNDKKSNADEIDMPEAIEQKAENLVILKEKIAATSVKITNEWVQKELGVSDATAVRYLDALEKEGIIKQVGETGRSTYYTKI